MNTDRNSPTRTSRIMVSLVAASVFGFAATAVFPTDSDAALTTCWFFVPETGEPGSCIPFECQDPQFGNCCIYSC